MENKNIYDSACQLADKLTKIDFGKLPISDYNKAYINRLKPAFHYYMSIYARCIALGLESFKGNINETTLVDFGGGSGFLSIFASYLGFRNIIYVDINPKSVQTVSVLKEETGYGPSTIIEGSSAALAKWCTENNVSPHLLIATDLIEHVYDLNPMFDELSAINNQMTMIFTTASTPFNPIVKRRLHKAMVACEKGNMENPNYYTLRFDFIKKELPNASDDEVAKLAELTRGMIFQDIRKAIESNNFPQAADRYNTCDPRNGNWMERILPISSYEELGKKHGYTINVEKGFYNVRRNKPLAATLCKAINCFIQKSGKAGFSLAPFIILQFSFKR